MCLAVCLVVAHDIVLAQQQANSTTGNEKTVLRGTVVNSVTHQPIGRALVKSTDGRFATMTNDRGQFEMVFKEKKNDSPGTPNGPGGAQPWLNGGGTNAGPGAQAQQVTVDRPDFLTARRVGFLTPQTSWGDAIAVARDQDEVTIPLTPEARMVGHVTLADGDGAADMPVELYRQTVQSGRTRWVHAGSAQARSDGEFRFADLEAGTYKLYSAELQDRDPVTSNPRGQGYGYPPDYYPSSTDFAGAAAIHLAAGETFQASLAPEKRRYYRVHIGITNSDIGRANMAAAGVEVERDGHPGPGFTLGMDYRDGSVAGILPDGNYLVKVSTQSANALTGVANLTVRGGPAAGMVTLLPGTDVDVRVHEEFQHPEPLPQITDGLSSVGQSQKQGRRSPIQLQLSRVEEFDQGRVYMAQPPGDPDAEGLVIPGVAAGEYRVTVQTPSGYVAAIRCGDTDLLNSSLVIGGGSSSPPIEVTLRDDGAEIEGSISEMASRGVGNTPNRAAYIYLVPTRAEGEVKVVVPQPNGEFQVAQLAPGTYRVLAFDRPRNDLEYWNEDAMRKYDAQTVTVVPGQKAKIQVSLSTE